MNVPVLLSGAAAGLGLAVLLRWWVLDVPDLASVRARRDRVLLEGAAPAAALSRQDAVLHALALRLGLSRHQRDLDIVGETPSTLALHKLGYALLGLMFPPVLSLVMAIVGLRVAVSVPVAFSLLLATALFFVPDADLRRRAGAERNAFRRAVCVYLELVALERAADAGAGESLARAAAVSDARPFLMVKDELDRAQLAGVPAWRGLARLAERVDVPELGDVADIMTLTGEDGAAVYGTLRAKASSLRSALLSRDAAQANTASEHMIIPVALLGVAFMALLGYPAFARIVFG
ncbi:MAG: hypothetical protein ABI468_02380 [Candidatus Nanopelagicales bacterium]